MPALRAAAPFGIALPLLLALALSGPSPAQAADQPAWAERAAAPYAETVLADGPLAHWRFDRIDGGFTNEVDPEALRAVPTGGVTVAQPGPRPSRYPAFALTNQSVRFGGGYLRVSDPGKGSPLDFGAGDSITLEAWVRPESIHDGQFVYIVGKGRTNRPGFARENQNYALRLAGQGGTARVSFLFREAGSEKSPSSEAYHRWTANIGFVPGDGWHHVAVSYTFGDGRSIRGYLDGRPVGGTWDMGGQTDAAPVVDDDELWIGSALGGSNGNTFPGLIDEVAIYRHALPAERIAARFDEFLPPVILPLAELPDDAVRVEIVEGIPDQKSWDFPSPPAPAGENYTTPAFAIEQVPHKYNARAVRTDRTNPILLRALGKVTLPKGEHRLLVRARHATRVWLDGKLILETPFHNISGSAHGRIRDVSVVKSEDPRNLRPLQPGDNEQAVTITGDGRTHLLRVESVLGGKNKRTEPGELSVSIETAPGRFSVLAPDAANAFPLTDAGWHAHYLAESDRLTRLEARRRREADQDRGYWEQRHELARRTILAQPAIEIPAVVDAAHTLSPVDHFINQRLHAEGKAPAELVDDWAFLRRVTLDVIGTVPTPEQVAEFFADDRPDRRERYIDRLLEHPGWADHWVAYWQDVLAENPSLVKPTLNNTGPFRFWIYESFYDNKPFDRFATELIRMEGSRYDGGPGGFELATQNDVPMAAKAHVVGQSLLAIEMKCARCHDAPFHDSTQKDLFSLAAMLGRKPQSVPKTSSIPLPPEELEDLIVQVTLPPGSKVEPEWAFDELIPADAAKTLVARTGDTREQVAALVTSPENERFAEVIANRLWARYTGRGLVEPVDDWQGVEPSHPQLLKYLARELVLSGYDLKHVARLILTSHTYQREPFAGPIEEPYLFAAPLRRQMTAEQIVDSMFVACDKDLHAGELTLDADGALPINTFINLGRPQRAWEFISLSNERDRPSLALPLAQCFLDVLTTFGWRNSRAEPVTVRDIEPTVLQPAILANGTVGRRFTRLSEDSAFTKLALEDQPIEELIEKVYARALTRRPTSEEAAVFADLLAEGYGTRHRDAPPEALVMQRPYNAGVSWSNHLSEAANRVKIELEEAVRRGDQPTPRLTPAWRERMEDMLWALMNSPEFVFVP